MIFIGMDDDETDLLVRQKKGSRPAVGADPGDTGQGRFGMYFHTLATTYKNFRMYTCVRARAHVHAAIQRKKERRENTSRFFREL